jgi:hypothetical protein
VQDRPDLIQSELSGLAFESLQQAFRRVDIDAMMALEPPRPEMYEAIHIFVDPAAGGPSSDYGILSVTLWRGMVTVSLQLTKYSSLILATRSEGVRASFESHARTRSASSAMKRLALSLAMGLVPSMLYECMASTPGASGGMPIAVA